MCGFQKQKKALTFYSQSLICHCNALVLLSFIILPYKTSAFPQLIFFCFFSSKKKRRGSRGSALYDGQLQRMSHAFV